MPLPRCPEYFVQTKLRIHQTQAAGRKEAQTQTFSPNPASYPPDFPQPQTSSRRPPTSSPPAPTPRPASSPPQPLLLPSPSLPRPQIEPTRSGRGQIRHGHSGPSSVCFFSLWTPPWSSDPTASSLSHGARQVLLYSDETLARGLLSSTHGDRITLSSKSSTMVASIGIW